jgi:hypothetical protein
MGKHKHDEKHREHHAKTGELDVETLNGIIQDYNFSPKGGVEGLLLQGGDRTVQVNVPPDAWPAVAHAAAVGQAVQVAVVPEPEIHKHPQGEHPVYRVVSLKPSSGPGTLADGPVREGDVKIEGIVSRFNYAKHGEANGVVLDNGDFLHMKPDGMKKVGLRVGQAVAAEGSARPMALGHRVIEAEVVNGVVLGSKDLHH